jgi:hypothetical protein
LEIGLERGETARISGGESGNESERTMVTSRGALAGRNVTPALRADIGGNKKPPSRMGTSGVVLVVPPHFAAPVTRNAAFACTARAHPRDAVGSITGAGWSR